jgi:hypothetical protein
MAIVKCCGLAAALALSAAVLSGCGTNLNAEPETSRYSSAELAKRWRSQGAPRGGAGGYDMPPPAGSYADNDAYYVLPVQPAAPYRGDNDAYYVPPRYPLPQAVQPYVAAPQAPQGQGGRYAGDSDAEYSYPSSW